LKATFQDPAAIKSLVEGLRGTKAKVHLPKFKTSYESSLAPMLVSFGMVKPFNVGADFTGITENGGVYISDVKHKAFVEYADFNMHSVYTLKLINRLLKHNIITFIHSGVCISSITCISTY
jgi:hypothetical protein